MANRLTRPYSEQALAGWLETDLACDREGRRYVPRWEQVGRVCADLGQLEKLSRSSDRFFFDKKQIEVALYHRLRNLFHLKPDLVFYDLTNTYFSRHGPEITKHGYCRSGRPRNVQIVVGVVLVAGWPVARHVLSGNTRNSTTVKEVIADLTARLDCRRVVFVGDRGMVSENNIDLLTTAEGD